jgi:hypothetical protein
LATLAIASRIAFCVGALAHAESSAIAGEPGYSGASDSSLAYLAGAGCNFASSGKSTRSLLCGFLTSARLAFSLSRNSSARACGAASDNDAATSTPARARPTDVRTEFRRVGIRRW